LWAIVHSFGFPGWFSRPMTLSTCLTGMTKTRRFCVYGHFYELLPLFWGYGGIYMAHDTQYMFERHDQKHIIFAFMAIFVSYAHSFGVPGCFTRSMTLSTCLRGMTKNLLF
jgi:hypothetical protein